MTPCCIKFRILAPQVLALFDPIPTLIGKLCKLFTKLSCSATTILTTLYYIRHPYIQLITRGYRRLQLNPGSPQGTVLNSLMGFKSCDFALQELVALRASSEALQPALLCI